MKGYLSFEAVWNFIEDLLSGERQKDSFAGMLARVSAGMSVAAYY
jgi:hypothetical protein